MIKLADCQPLVRQLKKHEGFSGIPYKDFRGIWTIAFGHNLIANPLSRSMVGYLVDMDGPRYSPSTEISDIGMLRMTKTRNLFTQPVTQEEGDVILQYDIMEIQQQMDNTFESFNPVLERYIVRGCALFEMGFQMGPDRLKGFKLMCNAVSSAMDQKRGSATEQEWWDVVAEEALDSQWARNHVGRANTIVAQLETGAWQYE